MNTPAVISWKSYLSVPFQRTVKSSDECSLCWQQTEKSHMSFIEKLKNGVEGFCQVGLLVCDGFIFLSLLILLKPSLVNDSIYIYIYNDFIW